jgi:hypothetical protein
VTGEAVPNRNGIWLGALLEEEDMQYKAWFYFPHKDGNGGASSAAWIDADTKDGARQKALEELKKQEESSWGSYYGQGTVKSVQSEAEVEEESERLIAEGKRREEEAHQDDLRRRAARGPMDREKVKKVVVSCYKELFQMDPKKRGDFNLEGGIISSMMGGGNPHEYEYFVENHMGPAGLSLNHEVDEESQSLYNEFCEVATEIEKELLFKLNQTLNEF